MLFKKLIHNISIWIFQIQWSLEVKVEIPLFRSVMEMAFLWSTCRTLSRWASWPETSTRHSLGLICTRTDSKLTNWGESINWETWNWWRRTSERQTPTTYNHQKMLSKSNNRLKTFESDRQKKTTQSVKGRPQIFKKQNTETLQSTYDQTIDIQQQTKLRETLIW